MRSAEKELQDIEKKDNEEGSTPQPGSGTTEDRQKIKEITKKQQADAKKLGLIRQQLALAREGNGGESTAVDKGASNTKGSKTASVLPGGGAKITATLAPSPPLPKPTGNGDKKTKAGGRVRDSDEPIKKRNRKGDITNAMLPEFVQFVHSNNTLNVDKFKTEWIKLHPEASKNAVANRLKEVAEKEGRVYRIRPDFEAYVAGGVPPTSPAAAAAAAAAAATSSSSSSAVKRPLEGSDGGSEPPKKRKVKVVSAFSAWVKEVQSSYKEREADKTAEMSKEDRNAHLKTVLKNEWEEMGSEEKVKWEAKAEEINIATQAAATA